MASKIGTFETHLNATLWNQLKQGVPEGVLQLRYEMQQIEDHPSTHKTQTVFDQLIKVLSPLFIEAKMVPNLNPASYTQLQETLRQKWEDEAFLTIWNKGQLRNQLKLMRSLTGQGPQSLQEIRAWMRNKPERLGKIYRLDLKDLGIKVCPQEISAFYNLKFLDLSGNQLKHFDLDLSQMTQLELLHIENNALSLFSSILTPCTALNNLSLAGNKLTHFSADLTQATRLNYLKLSGNQLEEFSSDLRKCTRLLSLSLGSNRLRRFRVDLTQHPWLSDLSVAGNQLTDFRTDLRRCTRLSTLNISNNEISSFYSDLSRCEYLTHFWYDNNPIGSSQFDYLAHKPWEDLLFHL